MADESNSYNSFLFEGLHYKYGRVQMQKIALLQMSSILQYQ